MGDVELREIASILEEVQFASEYVASQSDRTKLLEAYAGRAKFHAALRDPSVSDADIARLSASDDQQSLSGGALNEDAVRELREKLTRVPVNFTHAEPPSTTATLTYSFARVWRFVQRDIPDANFIIATDWRYRPHASVQEWSPGWYLILMGNYLVADVAILAHVLAKYVADARAELGDEPWCSEYFPQVFTAAMERCELRYQFPYKLCSAAEGERYRFAVQLSSDPVIARIAQEIKAGAVDFLLGHELAHVALGHLREPASVPEGFPSRLSPACEILRAQLGDSAESLLAAYRTRFLSSHERELDADAMGLLWAAGDGPKGAWDLRLFGAQLVVCLISFMDRARHVIELKRDPAALIGTSAYTYFGMVDLLLPKPSHPWGRTRSTALNNVIFGLYHDLIPKSELIRKARLMMLVQDTFARYIPYALGVMREINSRPGEYVAMLFPEGKIWTRYFPDFKNDSPVEETITVASEFYGKASGVIWMLHCNHCQLNYQSSKHHNYSTCPRCHRNADTVPYYGPTHGEMSETSEC